jgi:hypothetical protein
VTCAVTVSPDAGAQLFYLGDQLIPRQLFNVLVHSTSDGCRLPDNFKRVLRATSRISPDYVLVLTCREEVGATPIAPAGYSAVSMTDDSAGGVVYDTWDVTAARRKVINGLTPVVIPRDKGWGIRNRMAL